MHVPIALIQTLVMHDHIHKSCYIRSQVSLACGPRVRLQALWEEDMQSTDIGLGARYMPRVHTRHCADMCRVGMDHADNNTIFMMHNNKRACGTEHPDAQPQRMRERWFSLCSSPLRGIATLVLWASPAIGRDVFPALRSRSQRPCRSSVTTCRPTEAHMYEYERTFVHIRFGSERLHTR